MLAVRWIFDGQRPEEDYLVTVPDSFRAKSAVEVFVTVLDAFTFALERILAAPGRKVALKLEVANQ